MTNTTPEIKYRCNKCDYSWGVEKPGPRSCAECPKCQNRYFTWINFEDWINKYQHN